MDIPINNQSVPAELTVGFQLKGKIMKYRWGGVLETVVLRGRGVLGTLEPQQLQQPF